jgi:phosphoserine phosphatase
MTILQDVRVQEFLELHSNHPPGTEKVAVFDCDGTILRGDIGEAMLYRQIEQFHFRRSPAEIWSDSPVRGELASLFDSLKALPQQERHSHPDFPSFADLILSWYFDQIQEGKVAKACSDIVRLFAGYTRQEVRVLARENYREELSAPLSHRTLGRRTLPRGIRYLKETVDLLRALQDLQFTIWAVSGSNKWSVEPVFEALGVSESRVIGIDLADEQGVLLPRTESPVPIQEKKVEALQAHGAGKLLLVASDSRYDIPLLLAAEELRVLVNSRRRSSDDFFRLAGLRRDDSWIVIENPVSCEGVPSRG